VRRALLCCLPDKGSGFVLEEIGFGSEFEELYPASVRLQCDPVSDMK
jgi:hypothetical protein